MYLQRDFPKRMIKLLQLIVLVSFFSCLSKKNKNNNLEDVLYNSAIDSRFTNYSDDISSDINIGRKIDGLRQITKNGTKYYGISNDKIRTKFGRESDGLWKCTNEGIKFYKT